MQNCTRKIVILDEIKSPYIEQAIFILKDASLSGDAAVREAERIVGEYLKRFEPVLKPLPSASLPVRKKRFNLAAAFWGMICLAAVFAALYILKYF